MYMQSERAREKEVEAGERRGGEGDAASRGSNTLRGGQL